MPKDGVRAASEAIGAPPLGGRYQLDELIGRGGMAAVWRATDIEFGRSVAVKRLHARHLDDVEFAERFRREAHLVARLSHPNLVRMLDAGEDDGGPYLVLELVEGETLKERIRREHGLDPSSAAELLAQVADALEYAHGQGIVHRDIKSSNVLIGADGTAKLADFGIARLLDADTEPSLTQTDMMVGSADYIAPEQAEGRPVDARTDIYSLGIVLYEALTGELPFPGDQFVAVALRHVNDPLPDPREKAPDVPIDLAAVALRAAAKDPRERFASAAELAAALRGEGSGGTAVLPLLGDGGTTTRSPRVRQRRVRRGALAGAVVAVVAVAAAAAIVFQPLGVDRGSTPELTGVDRGSTPELTSLAIASASDLDPEGDGRERPHLVPLALDAPGAWSTERYASANFGILKGGVGLVLALEQPASVSELVVTSPTPGAAFEVLGPEGPGGVRQRLGGGRLAGDAQVVPLTSDDPVSELVLWLTELVPDEDGRFWAAVEQVEVRGVAKPLG